MGKFAVSLIRSMPGAIGSWALGSRETQKETPLGAFGDRSNIGNGNMGKATKRVRNWMDGSIGRHVDRWISR